MYPIILPVSLNYQFVIAPSVFSNVYLQFLWIDIFLIAPSVFSNVYLLQRTFNIRISGIFTIRVPGADYLHFCTRVIVCLIIPTYYIFCKACIFPPFLCMAFTASWSVFIKHTHLCIGITDLTIEFNR